MAALGIGAFMLVILVLLHGAGIHAKRSRLIDHRPATHDNRYDVEDVQQWHEAEAFFYETFIVRFRPNHFPKFVIVDISFFCADQCAFATS